MNYAPGLMENILVWIGGVAAVQALTEHLKSLWRNSDPRLKKLLNYFASVFVSLTTVGVFLFLTDSFSFKSLFLYAVPIWLTASGLYDVTHAKNKS